MNDKLRNVGSSDMCSEVKHERIELGFIRGVLCGVSRLVRLKQAKFLRITHSTFLVYEPYFLFPVGYIA
jgi:hypothetical protein